MEFNDSHFITHMFWNVQNALSSCYYAAASTQHALKLDFEHELAHFSLQIDTASS
jgi:hypothetical protein